MQAPIEMRAPTFKYNFTIDPANPHSVYHRLLRFCQGTGLALEIGCATGFFSRHLVQQGYRVYGVEIDAEAAQQARGVCEHVFLGDIETGEIQGQINEQFDLVVLGDVLEHLKWPDTLLRQIRTSWLAPGGWVVLSTPNSGHWIFRREVLHGRFPYREYGLFDRQHLRFYTRASLAEMVRACGYEIENWAWTTNHNTRQDITIPGLSRFYRMPRAGAFLNSLEGRLAAIFPNVFAYQFILRIRPRGEP